MGSKKNRDKGKAFSAYVTEKLDDIGYYVEGRLINFGNYGVPQDRTRFILVGIRKDLPKAAPETVTDFFVRLEENRLNFLESKNLPESVTLSDAIGDLLKCNGTKPSLDTIKFEAGTYGEAKSRYQVCMRIGASDDVVDSHRFANHRPDVAERLRYILDKATKNKNVSKHIKDKYSLLKHTLIPLDPGKRCRTLTSNPDDLIHYCEPRSLTVREYARIQGFPDSFEIKGRYTTGGLRRRSQVPRYTQIGNSIPPLFGEQSGLILKQLLA